MAKSAKVNKVANFQHLRLQSVCIFVTLITLFACSTSEQPKIKKSVKRSSTRLFRRLNPTQTNIDFANRLKPETEALFIKEYKYMFNGGGVAIIDINNDGLNDIFLTGNEVGNRLYLNLGDMKFQDISKSSGIGQYTGWFTGVTTTDINADGFLDIYVCKSYAENIEDRKNLLFVNNQNNTFAELADAYQIADDGFSTQAAFFDYDLDGLLDVYVMNHPDRWNQPLPFQYPGNARKFPNQDRLYKNLGNGKFQDNSKEAGLLPEQFGGYGLGLAVGDVDHDHDLDIYVSNDYESPDFLYINNGDGTFSEQLQKRLGHTSMYGMGVDMADYNNDGHLDIYAMDMAADGHLRSKTQMRSMQPERFDALVNAGLPHQYMYNALQTNHGDGTFSDLAFMNGVAKTDWSWSALFADLDLDGNKDLFISNGFRVDDMDNDYWTFAMRKYGQLLMQRKSDELALQMLQEMPSTPVDNYAFQNLGNKFVNRTIRWGLSDPGFSQGVSYGDLDNDGDLDLIVNNLNAEVSVYENQLEKVNPSKKSIKIKLNYSTNNQFGIGTKITIKSNQGIQYQEVMLTRGFQSAVSPEIVFGYDVADSIQNATVIWPNGRKQMIKPGLDKDLITISYQANLTTDDPDSTQQSYLARMKGSNVGLKFKHTENPFNDYQSEILLPYKYSMLGPTMTVGDMNGDLLDDVFIGGAIGQAGVIFLQQSDGNFAKTQSLIDDRHYEDCGSALLDADSDGDLDLLVSSGGNEYRNNPTLHSERLYLNNGLGTFTRAQTINTNISSGVVRPADFDQDGDMDVFLAGRQTPGQYPVPSNSHMLINEKGALTQARSGDLEFENLGMVTDANWSDLDNDGDLDLIVLGEWMGILIFINEEGELTQAKVPGLTDRIGWWQAVAVGDFDHDGDVDIVAGNIGLNYKYHATRDEPFHVYANDFDDNGKLDIVLSYLEQGLQFPLRGRQCSSQQMPFIAEKFPTYAAFGKATLSDIYGQKLENAIHYAATEFATVYIENLGDFTFKVTPLPSQAQVSSVNAIVSADVNEDDHLDLILAGNLFQSEIETPRNDASHGILMLGNGHGKFQPVSKIESGLDARKDVKVMKLVQTSGGPLLVVGNNNDALEVFRINLNSP